MTRETAAKSALMGTVVLAASNLIVKVIGAFFKIPLQNVIGDEGMGYFNQAYIIYSVMLSISTAGLSVAMSKMVAESNALRRKKEVKRVYNTAMFVFVVLGLIGMFALLFCNRLFAGLMGISDSYFGMLIIAPAVLFVCVMSAFRGYFQGHSVMMPTAVSQVLEALCKMGLGMAIALYLKNKGYPLHIVAGGAIAGVTIGTFAGMMFLMIRKKFGRESKPLEGDTDTVTPMGALRAKLLKIAIPITFSAAVMSLTNFIDSVLVANRLQTGAGMTRQQAATALGAYTGQATTMFNLPPTIIVAIVMSIIPAISAAMAVNDRTSAKRTIETALRMTGIIALPCAAGFIALARPILSLLFRQGEVDAAPMLMILGIAVIFVSLVLVTNAIFQSLGKVNIPLFTMLAGGVIKIITNYILVGNKDIIINGAPIGTAVCYGSIAILNFIMLAKVCGIIPNFYKAFVKPAVAASVTGVTAYFVSTLASRFINPKIATLVAVAAAAVIYAILLIVLRIITKDDIRFLPKSDKILKIIGKFI